MEVGDSAILGNAEAPVTIAAFMDFECPFCVREYPKLKAVLAAYPQQVRLVFKHRPLSFHKKAPAAHAAAQLAFEQGGHWGMRYGLISPLRGGAPAAIAQRHDQHRAVGLADHFLGDVAEQGLLQ